MFRSKLFHPTFFGSSRSTHPSASQSWFYGCFHKWGVPQNGWFRQFDKNGIDGTPHMFTNRNIGKPINSRGKPADISNIFPFNCSLAVAETNLNAAPLAVPLLLVVEYCIYIVYSVQPICDICGVHLGGHDTRNIP